MAQTEIPEDIFEAAEAVIVALCAIDGVALPSDADITIARALLAEREAATAKERERAANLAEDVDIVLPEWCPVDAKFTEPAIDHARMSIASSIRGDHHG